jgi:hypothetical protein
VVGGGSELQRPEGWGQRASRKPLAQRCGAFPFREKTRLLTLSLRRVQNEASR